jgi:hypothetical protein
MMMRTLISLVFLFPLAALACDDDGGGGGGAAEITGGFNPAYRTSSGFFTQMSGLVPGSSPHGDTQIWYTTNIRSLISQSSFTVPKGTTSIKEFDMDKDGQIDGLAVMVKREAGFDSANNDWHYEMRDTAGNVMDDPPAGANPMCIGCHVASRGKDFLAGTGLR